MTRLTQRQQQMFEDEMGISMVHSLKYLTPAQRQRAARNNRRKQEIELALCFKRRRVNFTLDFMASFFLLEFLKMMFITSAYNSLAAALMKTMICPLLMLIYDAVSLTMQKYIPHFSSSKLNLYRVGLDEINFLYNRLGIPLLVWVPDQHTQPAANNSYGDTVVKEHEYNTARQLDSDTTIQNNEDSTPRQLDSDTTIQHDEDCPVSTHDSLAVAENYEDNITQREYGDHTFSRYEQHGIEATHEHLLRLNNEERILSQYSKLPQHIVQMTPYRIQQPTFNYCLDSDLID